MSTGATEKSLHSLCVVMYVSVCTIDVDVYTLPSTTLLYFCTQRQSSTHTHTHTHSHTHSHTHTSHTHMLTRDSHTHSLSNRPVEDVEESRRLQEEKQFKAQLQRSRIQEEKAQRSKMVADKVHVHILLCIYVASYPSLPMFSTFHAKKSGRPS